MLVFAFTLASLAFSPAAQPNPPRERESVVLSIDASLAGIRTAYTANPWAERVRVAVREADGLTSRSAYIVRHAPASAAVDAPDRTRIELGRLTILVDSSDIIATSTVAPGFHSRTRVTEGSTWRESLDREFKPLMLPQFALAAASDREPIDLTPFSPGVTFSTITRAERGTPNAGAIVLGGHSARGPVSLAVDPRTHRLRQLVASLTGPSNLTMTITLDFTPLPLGDSALWPADFASSREVAGFAELLAAGGARPDASPQPGDTIDPPAVTMLDGRAVRPAELLSPNLSPAEPDAPISTLLMLYTRIQAGEPRLAPEVLMGLREIQHARESAGEATPAGMLLITLIVPPSEGANLKLVESLAALLPDRHRPHLSFNAAAADTIDAFDPEAASVLVVLRPDAPGSPGSRARAKLIGSVVLDGREPDPDGLRREIESLLMD